MSSSFFFPLFTFSIILFCPHPLSLPCLPSLHASVPVLPPPWLCLVRDDLALDLAEAAGTQGGLGAVFLQCQKVEEGQVGRWAQSGVPPPSFVPGGCHLGLAKHQLTMISTHHAQNMLPHSDLQKVKHSLEKF